jgi:hypothetical protein
MHVQSTREDSRGSTVRVLFAFGEPYAGYPRRDGGHRAAQAVSGCRGAAGGLQRGVGTAVS